MSIFITLFKMGPLIMGAALVVKIIEEIYWSDGDERWFFMALLSGLIVGLLPLILYLLAL
jgi:hypothetical protein